LHKPVLIGDIGGTNARFAIASEDRRGFTSTQVLSCSDFPGAVDAIRFYLDQTGLTAPRSILLAVAGPVVQQQVSMTNNPWSISVGELRQAFASETIHLLNDFEALAYSIPEISNDELLPIGTLEPDLPRDADYTIAVVGPGTGLGAVGLCKRNGNLVTIAGEASHAGFSPETREQEALLSLLRDRFERVSIERLVSGPGLENIYQGLAQMQAETRSPLSAAEIFQASLDKNDPIARQSVELFFQILGQAAGDLALTLGAENGVYIAGGIARRYPQLLANSRLRSGFENKGRHRALMERIPTQLIMHEQAGLLGAASYAHLAGNGVTVFPPS